MWCSSKGIQRNVRQESQTEEGFLFLVSEWALMILTVASKGMLLKRGTGKNENWEQNRELEMKSLIGLSRVQVRFCSHFSFARSPCLYPRPPFLVLVTSLRKTIRLFILRTLRNRSFSCRKFILSQFFLWLIIDDHWSWFSGCVLQNTFGF